MGVGVTEEREAGKRQATVGRIGDGRLVVLTSQCPNMNRIGPGTYSLRTLSLRSRDLALHPVSLAPERLADAKRGYRPFGGLRHIILSVISRSPSRFGVSPSFPRHQLRHITPNRGTSADIPEG